MSRFVEVVSREDLRRQRSELLKRAGTDWSDLRRRAGEFALTDNERGIYDTISGIDWMLRRSR